MGREYNQQTKEIQRTISKAVRRYGTHPFFHNKKRGRWQKAMKKD
jgi:hypothetical protein